MRDQEALAAERGKRKREDVLEQSAKIGNSKMMIREKEKEVALPTRATSVEAW